MSHEGTPDGSSGHLNMLLPPPSAASAAEGGPVLSQVTSTRLDSTPGHPSICIQTDDFCSCDTPGSDPPPPPLLPALSPLPPPATAGPPAPHTGPNHGSLVLPPVDNFALISGRWYNGWDDWFVHSRDTTVDPMLNRRLRSPAFSSPRPRRPKTRRVQDPLDGPIGTHSLASSHPDARPSHNRKKNRDPEVNQP